MCIPDRSHHSFFVDDYRTGYALESKSPSWNELDTQEKKSLRNKFSTIKRAVRIVSLYADSYPLIPKKDVAREIAAVAEKRLRVALGFDDKTTISIYKLENQLKLPGMKELEKSLKLPDNTPEDARKFFNN